MDINYIKWMVEKAEGFEWVSDEEISMPDGSFFSGMGYLTGNEGRDVYYPLLLQRVIEQVNIEIDDPLKEISTFYDEDFGYMYIHKGLGSPWKKTIDEAKDAALEYIYEQEKDKT